MIFVVDSDLMGLESVKEALEPEGYELATFDGAESALDLLSTLDEPELIISEIQMHGMDGFDFKKSFNRQFPNNTTPFVFYTSKDDEQSIGRGLALGVDEYMVKPLSPKLFAMKIRNVMNRRNHYLIHTFYGDLSKLPFFKLMQFCESKGLTGEVEINGADTNLIISFKAGQLQSDMTSDDVLLKVYDMTDGTFIVRSMPLDFTELMDFSVTEYAEAEQPEAVYTDKEKPMGKLSGVQVDKRLFQVQTEFVTQPSPQLATIVVLDGRVLTKRINSTPAGRHTKQELEQMIEVQHNEMEAEIREKLNAIVQKKSSGDSASAEEEFKTHFELGFEKYRAEDFAGALESWKKAYEINPTDKSLETNIRILSKKLGVS